MYTKTLRAFGFLERNCDEFKVVKVYLIASVKMIFFNMPTSDITNHTGFVFLATHRKYFDIVLV